jgi:hypothetical protein
MKGHIVMRKTFIPWFILAFLLLFAQSCDSAQPSTESNQVNDQQTIYSDNQPLHKYDYSPERDELQQIYDARMKVVNTWTVIYSMGKPIFVCPSKGYPIPYTTQLTNPSQVQEDHSEYGGNVVIPQAEPNGLYTGTSTATWVLCIRTLPGGGSEIDPVYSEPDALAFPYPVKIDDNGIIVDAGGNSSVSINVKNKS